MKIVHYNKGFTLVEMIVSLGIFTIVALVAVGALIKIMDANKKSIALKTAINNMNFTLESMSREMRVGKNFMCDLGAGFVPNCESTINQSWTIKFNSSKTAFINGSTALNGTCNLIYVYRFVNNGNGDVDFQKGQQENCAETFTYITYYPLISDEVKITGSLIAVDGRQNVTPPIQPNASFFFKGYSGAKAREQAEFAVQTSITQRLPK